ncbi:hypothetical protein C8P63_103149 [Melghirimyces profundicolus]|uniref:Uncharacterized protein n=1 Tax=Melghirimyces profundicolus TaxID=1242148 RepID=A0A2T6C7R5_9BACL|nr:hypothetical protein C8P63_103149 [Melghirimyces profundicolus]
MSPGSRMPWPLPFERVNDACSVNLRVIPVDHGPPSRKQRHLYVSSRVIHPMWEKASNEHRGFLYSNGFDISSFIFL